LASDSAIGSTAGWPRAPIADRASGDRHGVLILVITVLTVMLHATPKGQPNDFLDLLWGTLVRSLDSARSPAMSTGATAA